MTQRIPRRLSTTDLDLDVSRRQAFGEGYGKPHNWRTQLSSYMLGELILPPHPALRVESTDWTLDPLNDRNWKFQHHTLRWLNPVRWAALEGNEKARAEWIRVVRSWAESNIPASRAVSDFAWVDMADGNRAIQLSLGAPLLEAGDDWYVELLEYHRDWLIDPANIVGKNHGLHQHCGLLVVGAVLNDTEATVTAATRIRDQFDSTFDAQGTNDEGSVIYHQHNLVWWSQAWDRVRNEGIEVPSQIDKKLKAAANVLAHFSQPDGELPQIGNGSRSKIRQGLSPVTDFIAFAGSRGNAPEGTALTLDRGYALSRSGWGETQPLADESHTVIRFGEAIRAHSHNDRGSIHIYSRKQRWLVDAGFYSYNSRAQENRHLKSRQAHNVVSIIGRKHNGQAPVELVSSSITSEFHDFVLSDTGYEPDKLSRRVIYLVQADCWIVFDKADSSDPVRIAQNWQIEPGISVQVRDNGFRLTSKQEAFAMYWLGRGTQLSLRQANKDTLTGWVGTKWRTLEAGVQLTAKSRPKHPYLVTLFGPHGPTPLSIVESRVSMTGNSLLLQVARGAARWIVTIRGQQLVVEAVHPQTEPL